jgi:hypothetical protein
MCIEYYTQHTSSCTCKLLISIATCERAHTGNEDKPQQRPASECPDFVEIVTYLESACRECGVGDEERREELLRGLLGEEGE